MRILMNGTRGLWRPLEAPDGAPAQVVVTDSVTPAAPAPVVEDPSGSLGAFEAPRAVRVADAAPEGPSREELQKQYEASQARLKDLEARSDPLAAIGQGFKSLEDNLRGIATRPIQVQAPAQGPLVDELGDLIKDLDANLLESPGAKIVKTAQAAMRQPLDTLVSSTFTMAERLVEATSPDRALFTAYKDEVRSEFARLDGRERVQDPVAAYERAFAVVKGRHLEEIFAQRQAAAAPVAAVAPAQAAPARPSAATMAQGTSAFAPQRQAQGEIVITPAQDSWVRDRMRQKGISEADYEEYVGVLVESGQLRV